MTPGSDADECQTTLADQLWRRSGHPVTTPAREADAEGSAELSAESGR